MLDTLIRKSRQLASDSILRRWLAGRLVGRCPGEPAFTRHYPPFLEGLPLPKAQSLNPAVDFAELPAAAPADPIEIPLPGLALHLRPGDETDLFQRSFADIEALLALYRFAWLPLLGGDADPAWVQALWTAWHTRHGDPDDGWSWHPYTAAERAINLLRFARCQGLPGAKDETLAMLAAHGPAIAARLEYFGDHNTSNHLSNNGRGLYILGLELGLGACAQMGARVLLEEATRIFRPSGILREGSSHYHLLLTRNYVEVWLAARTHGRSEEPALRDIAARALAVIPLLVLPGGMPLVGDISPDCPPSFLAGLLPEGDLNSGWTGLLDKADRKAFAELRDNAVCADPGTLVTDGWLRADFSPWSGLWHVAPEGWPPMPGHGHQDCGGFELHFADEPVFVDLGRGTYEETVESAFYRSARAHNTVLIDGADPYPPNRPYYDAAFRRRVGGPPPELRHDADSVVVRHHGFTRLGGVGTVSRRWHFSGAALTITDQVDGSTRRTVTRLLHTPLAAEKVGDDVILRGRHVSIRVAAADARLTLRPATRWVAYGDGRPATVIDIGAKTGLPWTSVLTVEVL